MRGGFDNNRTCLMNRERARCSPFDGVEAVVARYAYLVDVRRLRVQLFVLAEAEEVCASAQQNETQNENEK